MSKEPLRPPTGSRSELRRFFRDCFLEAIGDGALPSDSHRGRQIKRDGDFHKIVLIPKTTDVVLDLEDELVMNVNRPSTPSESTQPQEIWVLLPIPAPEILDHEGVNPEDLRTVAERNPEYIAYFLNADGVQAPYSCSDQHFAPYGLTEGEGADIAEEERLAELWLDRLRSDYWLGYITAATEAA